MALVVALALSLGSCKKEQQLTSGLYLQFVNHTGAPLSDLEIDTYVLGELGSGAATDYLPFERVYFDGGTICVLSGTATIEGESYTVLNPFCATMWVEFTEGMHRVAITRYSGPGYNYLMLNRLP